MFAEHRGPQLGLSRRARPADHDFRYEAGAYKRHWGAYGERPHDNPLPAYDPAQPPSRSFGSPVHCVRLTRDGLVYVCDRVNNRVQVFRRDGSFVQEFFISRETRLNGAVADLLPSPDQEQRLLFSVDNSNSEARVSRRRDGEVLSTFGRMGRYAGQFMVPHNVAVDSLGSLYISGGGHRPARATLPPRRPAALIAVAALREFLSARP